jgi:cytoskeletal protein RodZ
MKEIGESFKNARETIGISIEEACKDLNITESQLENLEDGNVNAFKDVFFLKDTVKKYTKYLNLNEDEIMDLFNDFMFGYTSRIPVDDILEQTREIEILERKSEDGKIVSPYTKSRKKKSTLKYVLLYSISVLLLIALVIVIIKFVTDKKSNEYNCFDIVRSEVV